MNLLGLLLTRIPRRPASAIRVRADLDPHGGHTITIERVRDLTAALEINLGRDAVGQRVIAERTGGRLAKVCALESDLSGGVTIEDAAASYAQGYGARFLR